MRYVDKSYCILIPLADRLGIRQRSYFSILRTLMFSLRFIIFASCSSKLSHLFFRLTLERNLIQEVREMPQPHITRQWRQALSTNKLKKTWHKTQKILALECKRIQCHVYSVENKNHQQNSSAQNGMLVCLFWCISHPSIVLGSNWH